jgi:nucleoside-diphosphate-sugar epimerase
MALSRWVDATRLGRPLRIFGSLERTRDFTDVREVARALTALLGSTGVVNVGSGRPRTLGEAVDAVGSVLGVEPLVRIEPASADEVADTWADTSRLADLTGQVPQTDLVDAVERLVAAPVLAAVG